MSASPKIEGQCVVFYFSIIISRTCLQAMYVSVLMGMREMTVREKSMNVSPTHATMLVSVQ